LADSAVRREVNGRCKLQSVRSLERRASREQTWAAVQHEITFADDAADVVIVTSGEATLPGFRAHVVDLVTSAEYRPGMNILVDHTSLDANRLTPADMRAIADLVIEFDAQIGPGLCAVVVPSPYKFRLARIWQEHVDDEVLMQTQVFYSRDVASHWLLKERPRP
jgi:hypothetical protein